MKRIILLLTALAIPALGDDVTVTINPHSETEVAMATAAGFSSVEEWYADLNRHMILPDEIASLNRTWASLSLEVKNRLADAETKWVHWYDALPSKTPRDIAKRIDAVANHRTELEAWIPKAIHQPAPLPSSNLNSGLETQPLRPPTTQEMGTESHQAEMN
jgi:hypothetical protein